MAVANTNQYSARGVQYAFWAARTNGYPYGTTGILANGANAGMGRMLGVQDVNITVPQAQTINVPGDNGVLTSFLAQPTELPSGTLAVGAQDQNFAAFANGVKIFPEGDWDLLGDLPSCYAFSDMAFVFNSPGSSQESTSRDESSWVVTMLMNAQVQAALLSQMQSGNAHTWTHRLNLKRAGKALWGQVFTALNYGATSFGILQFNSPYPVTLHTFIGNGTLTSVTLNETPAAASGNAVQVWQNDSKLTYTTGYTVNPTTKVVTFASAPANGSVNVIPYMFLPSC